MDTLVDVGLVPDTSKWRYPTSKDVSGSRKPYLLLIVRSFGVCCAGHGHGPSMDL